MQVGDQLPELEKAITHDVVLRYADASGDLNPLHIDATYGATTQFGSTVAHGMLLMGHISEMLTMAFGSHWASTGRLDVRFRRPAKPGDKVIVKGRVTSVARQPNATVLCFAVECRIQGGITVAQGVASLSTPSV